MKDYFDEKHSARAYTRKEKCCNGLKYTVFCILGFGMLVIGILCFSGAFSVTFAVKRMFRYFSENEHSAAYSTADLSTIKFRRDSFQLEINDKVPGLFQDSMKLYIDLIFHHHVDSSSMKEVTTPVCSPLRVLVQINNYIEINKSIKTNESYEVLAEDCRIIIRSENVFGSLYALEEISQLIEFDFRTEFYSLNLPIHLSSSPAFPHRELLIDTGRHFLPIKSIERLLDSMLYAKVNVLHWHISDSQSFPLCLKSLPSICQFGAFSEFEKYTVADVKHIVKLAMSKGIRVIPEIDTPGHAASLCGDFPEICSGKHCQEPLNVASEATFDILKLIYTELSEIFIDDYIHVGGDEVNRSCWLQNPQIVRWMKENDFTDKEAYGYFVGRVHEIILSLGKIPVVWNEVYDSFGRSSAERQSNSFVLDDRVIVQKWTGSDENTPMILQDGHKVIISKAWPVGWYLDHLKVDWKMMFEQNICRIGKKSDSICSSQIIGGGGEMWGEKVDASDLGSTVWPRMAAIALNLWVGPKDVKIDQIESKLRRFRCHLLQRGITAAPLTNKAARDSPSKPGSCLV